MRYVLHPAYSGYAYVVPEKVRGGISNFRENLKSPIRFVNHLLQGEFAQAGVEFGRFIINTCTSLGLRMSPLQSKPCTPTTPVCDFFSYIGNVGRSGRSFCRMAFLRPLYAAWYSRRCDGHLFRSTNILPELGSFSSGIRRSYV